MYNRLIKSNSVAFTLIELIVVIIIIGILASIAVPAFSSYIKNSKDKANAAIVKTIRDSLEKYYLENGQYPKFVFGERIATQAFDPYGYYHSYTEDQKDSFSYLIHYLFKSPIINYHCSRASELSGKSWNDIMSLGSSDGFIHWMFYSNIHSTYRWDPDSSQHLFGTGIKALLEQDSLGDYRVYDVQIDENSVLQC